MSYYDYLEYISIKYTQYYLLYNGNYYIILKIFNKLVDHKMKNILIDDERNLSEVKAMLPHLNLNIEFDIILRSYQEAIDFSNEISIDDTIFLDHDLGTDEIGVDGHGVISYFFKNNVLPKAIIIVSANPIGYRNIEQVIINDLKYKKLTDRYYIRS